MSKRILLVESGAPLVAGPQDWKMEMVTPPKFGEDLIESYVARTEDRYKSLTESLLEKEQITEEQVATILSGFKDHFVGELREAHQQKRMRVSGPAQLENQKNGNGRMYPTELWDKVLGESSDFMARLNNRQVLGELEHPAEGNTKLPRVSHLVEKVWRKEGVVYASHLLFRTPNGQIIEELYNAGAVPGVSSRGAGSTKTVDGVDVVEASDFHLDTWDFVAQPSVATARPAEIGESEDSHRPAPVSERAISAPKNVNTYDKPSGEPNMSQLTESTEAVLEAGAAVKNSQAYLNGNEITLDGLLQHQESVVEAMSQLSASVVPEELAQRASQVRAQAHEHMQTLRREIKRVQEKGDMPDNFKPKDDTDTNGDTSNSSDGGGNNATPGNKKNGNGDDDSAEEALARVMNLESLRDVTAADIIEELAGRNRELRIQTENQVPEEKYRRAIDLGEDVVERANSDRDFYESQIKQLKEQLQEAKKSDQASRAMLEATVSRYRGEVVENAVDGLLEKNPQLKPIEGRLRECKTLPEVRSLIEGIVKPLSEGTGSSRPDLPPTVSQNLNESVSERGTSPAPAQQSSSGGNDLMGLLAESERSGFPQA